MDGYNLTGAMCARRVLVPRLFTPTTLNLLDGFRGFWVT
jgi:hypothetical protein